MDNKGIKVAFAHGEGVRTYLLSHDLMTFGKKYTRKDGFIYFPVKDTITEQQRTDIQNLNGSFVEYEHVMPDKWVWNTLDKNLDGLLSEEEEKHLITSFDIVGDIIAIEIPYHFTNSPLNKATTYYNFDSYKQEN